MTIKEKFESIDQGKLKSEQVAFLQKIKTATKDFTLEDAVTNEKIGTALDKMISAFKESNPDAIKTKQEEKKEAPEQKAAPEKKATAKRTPAKRTGQTTAAKKAAEAKLAKEKEAEAKAEQEKAATEKKAEKKVKSEMEKLLQFVRRRKELKNISGTDIMRDARRQALPSGRRTSKEGNVYYEYDENRTDRTQGSKSGWYLENGGAFGAGHFAKGGALGKSLYVEYSSWFDSNKYDTDKITSVLESIGAKNIRLENDRGWSNQPEVVVFNGDKDKAEEALNKAFETEWIHVSEKDWRKPRASYENGGAFGAGHFEDGGALPSGYNDFVYFYSKDNGKLVWNVIHSYNHREKPKSGDKAYKWLGKNKGLVINLEDGTQVEIGSYGRANRSTLENDVKINNGIIRILDANDDIPSFMDGGAFGAGHFEDGGALGENFKEVIDLGAEQYYTRHFGTVGTDSMGDVELVVVAKIMDLEDYVSEDELPEDGKFQLDITLVPYPKFLSNEILESANDEDSSSISDDSVVNVVNYAGGLNYNPQVKVNFETQKEALDYLMSKELKDRINADGFMSGFIMDRAYNRAGQTNWGFLDYLMGVTDKPFENGGAFGAGHFAEGGSIKNQYEGKHYSDVWDDMWSVEQKYHFLSDHKNEIGFDEEFYNQMPKTTKRIQSSKGSEIGFLFKDSDKIVATGASELPRYVKFALEKHIREGQYANGGAFGAGHFKEGGSLATMSYIEPTSKKGYYELTEKHGIFPAARIVESDDDDDDDDAYVGRVSYIAKSSSDDSGIKGMSREYVVMTDEEEDALEAIKDMFFEEMSKSPFNRKKYEVLEVTFKNKKMAMGGFTQMDLAGHLGGAYDFGRPTYLDGFTGTQYTGLVGETGALSSGEMFENGGAFGAGHFSKGGSVKSELYPNVNFNHKILINGKPKYLHLNKSYVVSVDGSRQYDFIDVDGNEMNGYGFSVKEALKMMEDFQNQKEESKTNPTKKYVDHDDIESVTLNVNGNFVTFEGKDFLNGANLMEKGGDLSKIATYFPVRNIVRVKLKNGDTVKPLNGYWLKNGSEPMGKKPNSTTETPQSDGVEKWQKAVTNEKEDTRKRAEEIKKLLQEYYGKSGRNFKVEKRDGKYVVTWEYYLTDKMELGGAFGAGHFSKGGSVKSELYPNVNFNHKILINGKPKYLHLNKSYVNSVDGSRQYDFIDVDGNEMNGYGFSVKEALKMMEDFQNQKEESKTNPTKIYVDHDDIVSVTLKLNDKTVTLKGSDVLNGANLEEGGELSKIAKYVPKRDVLSVKLKNGETVKPLNGYWVKKDATTRTVKRVSIKDADIKAGLKFNLINGEVIEIKRLFDEPRGRDTQWVEYIRDGKSNENSVRELRLFLNRLEAVQIAETPQNGYVAFYNDKRIELYADNMLDAKNKAVATFKARKPNMVSVVLAEKGGKQVTHTPSFSEGGAFGAGHFMAGGMVEEGDRVIITTTSLGKDYVGMSGTITPRKLINDKYSVKLSNGLEMAFSKDEFRHDSINPRYSNGGAFGAGHFAEGGKLTKSEVMRKMYKPSGDYFFEQKGNDLIVHLTSRDAGNSIESLMDKYDVKHNGRGYYGSSYVLSRKNKMANGGAFGAGHFMAGGNIDAVMQDASQSYVNYYLGEGAAQGIYAKGGMLSANERYVLEMAGLTGLRKEAILNFISENGLTESEVLNIVIGLGRRQIKGTDVSTAVVGRKNNKYAKEVIAFAKSDKALKAEFGGSFGAYN